MGDKSYSLKLKIPGLDSSHLESTSAMPSPGADSKLPTDRPVKLYSPVTVRGKRQRLGLPTSPLFKPGKSQHDLKLERQKIAANIEKLKGITPKSEPIKQDPSISSQTCMVGQSSDTTSSTIQSPATDAMSNFSYVLRLASGQQEEPDIVMLDHCYSMPWHRECESSLAQPRKILFVSKMTNNTRFSTNRYKEGPIVVDDDPPDPPELAYDPVKGRQMMAECERHVIFAKLDRIRGIVENKDVDQDEEEVDWTESVARTGWNDDQNALFDKAVKILDQDRLARLSLVDTHDEPVKRRAYIDKTSSKWRQMLGRFNWELKLVQWLHMLLIQNLSTAYLAAYLDILQTLKSKIPSLVDKMILLGNSHRGPNVEALNLLLKRPWDPIIPVLNQHKPRKLEGSPIIIHVPSGATSSKLPQSNRRIRFFNSQLQNLAKSVPISLHPENIETPAILEQLITEVKAKVVEEKIQNPGCPIILIGWGIGAVLACHVSMLESVSANICLGYPISGCTGKRGEVDDPLLQSNTPTLYVIGERATNACVDDMEDIRHNMNVETGLVVIKGADNLLRMSWEKRYWDGITQTMVDRCIVDEISDFLTHIFNEKKEGGKKRKLSLESEIPSPKLSQPGTPQSVQPGSLNLKIPVGISAVSSSLLETPESSTVTPTTELDTTSYQTKKKPRTEGTRKYTKRATTKTTPVPIPAPVKEKDEKIEKEIDASPLSSTSPVKSFSLGSLASVSRQKYQRMIQMTTSAMPDLSKSELTSNRQEDGILKVQSTTASQTQSSQVERGNKILPLTGWHKKKPSGQHLGFRPINPPGESSSHHNSPKQSLNQFGAGSSTGKSAISEGPTAILGVSLDDISTGNGKITPLPTLDEDSVLEVYSSIDNPVDVNRFLVTGDDLQEIDASDPIPIFEPTAPMTNLINSPTFISSSPVPVASSALPTLSSSVTNVIGSIGSLTKIKTTPTISVSPGMVTSLKTDNQSVSPLVCTSTAPTIQTPNSRGRVILTSNPKIIRPLGVRLSGVNNIISAKTIRPTFPMDNKNIRKTLMLVSSTAGLEINSPSPPIMSQRRVSTPTSSIDSSNSKSNSPITVPLSSKSIISPLNKVVPDIANSDQEIRHSVGLQLGSKQSMVLNSDKTISMQKKSGIITKTFTLTSNPSSSGKIISLSTSPKDSKAHLISSSESMKLLKILPVMSSGSYTKEKSDSFKSTIKSINNPSTNITASSQSYIITTKSPILTKPSSSACNTSNSFPDPIPSTVDPTKVCVSSSESPSFSVKSEVDKKSQISVISSSIRTTPTLKPLNSSTITVLSSIKPSTGSIITLSSSSKSTLSLNQSSINTITPSKSTPNPSTQIYYSSLPTSSNVKGLQKQPGSIITFSSNQFYGGKTKRLITGSIGQNVDNMSPVIKKSTSQVIVTPSSSDTSNLSRGKSPLMTVVSSKDVSFSDLKSKQSESTVTPEVIDIDCDIVSPNISTMKSISSIPDVSGTNIVSLSSISSVAGTSSLENDSISILDESNTQEVSVISESQHNLGNKERKRRVSIGDKSRKSRLSIESDNFRETRLSEKSKKRKLRSDV